MNLDHSCSFYLLYYCTTVQYVSSDGQFWGHICGPRGIYCSNILATYCTVNSEPPESMQLCMWVGSLFNSGEKNLFFLYLKGLLMKTSLVM
jgi:hypothetical protein